MVTWYQVAIVVVVIVVVAIAVNALSKIRFL